MRLLVHIPSHLSTFLLPTIPPKDVPRIFIQSLNQLRRLDKPPAFHDQVYDVHYGKGYNQWVSDIQGDDLVRFVDYLDQVRHLSHLFAPRSSHRRLSTFLIPPVSPPRSVWADFDICGDRTVLPKLCAFPSQPLDIDSQPFAEGGSAVVYEGTLNSSNVCIKRIRMDSKYISTNPTKVCYPSPPPTAVTDETCRFSIKRLWCGNG